MEATKAAFDKYVKVIKKEYAMEKVMSKTKTTKGASVMSKTKSLASRSVNSEGGGGVKAHYKSKTLHLTYLTRVAK
jgi:hypothetical protein